MGDHTRRVVTVHFVDDKITVTDDDSSRYSSPQDFLLQYPDHVYTTLVKKEGKTIAERLPQLNAHVARLIHGHEVLHEGDVHVWDNENLCHAVDIGVDFATKNKEEDKHLVIAILFNDALKLHIQPHQQPQQVERSDDGQKSNEMTMCIVEVNGEPRKNPTVKNTSWVSHRAALEKARLQQATETILSKNYGLYEGLVTNIFVLIDAQYENGHHITIVTAPAHTVLPGTTRTVVIQACKQMNITVDDTKAPDLRQWRSFCGAFISNAVRGVVPIKTLHVRCASGHEQGAIPEVVDLSWSPKALQIVERLRSRVGIM